MAGSDADNQHEVRSEGDILVEVGDALGKIREIAQESRDKMLLYFIDMAIFQACESLCTVCCPSIVNELKWRPQPMERG